MSFDKKQKSPDSPSRGFILLPKFRAMYQSPLTWKEEKKIWISVQTDCHCWTTHTDP